MRVRYETVMEIAFMVRSDKAKGFQAFAGYSLEALDNASPHFVGILYKSSRELVRLLVVADVNH